MQAEKLGGEILIALRDLTPPGGEPPMAAIAKQVGCSRVTVYKALKEGWPIHDIPPLRQVMADEQTAARSRLLELLAGGRLAPEPGKHPDVVGAESEEDRAQIEKHVAAERDRQLARKQAIEARAEEGKGVAIARRNALMFGGMVAELSRTMFRVPKRLEALLVKDLEAGNITAKELVGMMRSAVRIQKESVEALKTAMHLERLYLGEPTAIARIELDSDLSADAATAMISRAARALERQAQFAEWGTLELVEGGDDAVEEDAA